MLAELQLFSNAFPTPKRPGQWFLNHVVFQEDTSGSFKNYRYLKTQGKAA